MKISHSKRAFLSVLFSAGVMLSSCVQERAKEEEAKTSDAENNLVSLTDAQFRMAAIKFGAVEMRTISGTVQASGQLDVPPRYKVSVSAPLGGVVKETDLLQGSWVKKGQAVALMQDNIYVQIQQEYKEAFNQLTYLKSEYERQQELAKENVGAKKTLQKASADYFSTKARLDGLRAKLQLINIDPSGLENGSIKSQVSLYSPINGYVTKMNVNTGSYVNPNEVLFEIVNTEHLHAELTVFEKDLFSIQPGQKVFFTLANDTVSRAATVYLIGKEISSDRSIRVHCHLEKTDENLIPGMFLTAVIETDSARVAALPAEAIVEFDGRKYIFILTERVGETNDRQDQQFEMIEIETGPTEDDYTQVVLPANFDRTNQVVFKGAYSLLSKMKNTEE